MNTRIDPDFALVTLLRLVAFHSFLVGIGLLVFPTDRLGVFGFHHYQGRFFLMQGGVFHLLMAFAYLLAAARPLPSLLLLVVTAKLTATVFLLLYYSFGERSWMVLASAVGDAIMAALVILSYWLYRRARSPRRQDSPEEVDRGLRC